MGPCEESRQPEEARRLVRGGIRAVTSGRDYLEIFDEAHSDYEDRFIAVGPIKSGMVLVVHTVQDDDAIRIISARWATKSEHALFLASPKDSHE